jgi:DNA replication initiation complex subunit (GINS family)
MEEELNYEKIREILQKCRKKEVIDLPEDFYKSARRYLESLQREFAKEKDVFSPKARALSDNINRVTQDIDEIYNLRESFVINAAIIRARGGEVEYTKSLSRYEKDLLNEIVECLRKAKERAFGNNDEGEEKSGSEEAKREEKLLVILEDLPPFVSQDRKSYNLKKGDIVTLPPETAGILIKNKKAKEVE